MENERIWTRVEHRLLEKELMGALGKSEGSHGPVMLQPQREEGVTSWLVLVWKQQGWIWMGTEDL